MGDAYSVDPETLADSVARMAEFQSAAEAFLAEIDTAVKSLHITWSGETAVAHAAAHRQWVHGATMMREALKQLHQAGAEAQGNYTSVMSTNRAMWS